MRDRSARRRAARFLASLPLLCVLAGPSVAEPAESSEDAAASGAVIRTDPIIITAKRRPSLLSDLAGNTSVLSDAELELIRADHPSEALNRLPGLNIQRGSGQEHLTAMRSPVLTGGAGAGSFLYLENGIPLRAPGFANVNGLFDAHLEAASALEVVRGPGTAFYGSNAIHGLINVITRAPTEDFAGFAEFEGGSFGRYAGTAWASDTVGGHGFFAAYTSLHEDGWRHDAGVDQQKLSLRWDTQVGATRIASFFAAQNLNQETAGFVQGPDAYKNSETARNNANPDAYRDVRSLRASSRIEWDANDAVTIRLTPFLRWNEMDFLQHFLPSQALEKNGHWSVGMLSSVDWTPTDNWEVIAGIDLDFTEGYLSEEQFITVPFGDFAQGVHYDYDVFATVVAPYVHTEWQAFDWARVVAGLRAEYTNYVYDNNADVKLSAPIGSGDRYIRPPDRVDDFLTLTPKLGFVFDLSDDATAFVNFARGARAPQTTDLYRVIRNQLPGDADPERIDSVEVGFRGRMGPVSGQIAGFFMKKKNFFFRDADFFNVTNGKTRHVGVEVETVIELPANFSFAGAATFASHTYRFDRPTGSSAESVTFGDDVDTAPRTISNVRLAWEPEDGSIVELEWQHMGRYSMNASNTVHYPGHEVLNLRAEQAVTENVALFFNARNLTNTDYAERADFGFGNERYFPGEDRAFSGGIKITF